MDTRSRRVHQIDENVLIEGASPVTCKAQRDRLSTQAQAVFLSGIHKTNKGLETVYNDRLVPLKQLKTIADAYAVAIIDAVNKANAGLTDAETAFKSLTSAQVDIRNNGTTYSASLKRVKTHLLFLCSRNQWRSPTAEALFKDHPRYSARSAGTEARARIKVTACHLGWADQIFCMERKHADRLRENFPAELAGKPLITLRIPDDFQRDDPALIALLREKLAAHLQL